jgi:hypothetical protein
MGRNIGLMRPEAVQGLRRAEGQFAIPSETAGNLLALLYSGIHQREMNRELALELEQDQGFQKELPNLALSRGAYLSLMQMLAWWKLKGPPSIRVKKVPLSTRAYNKRFLELANYIAAIIGHTHVEQRGEAMIPDDRALVVIRDLLLDFDETLLKRNSGKWRLKKLSELGLRPWRTDYKIIRQKRRIVLEEEDEQEVEDE